MRTFALVLLCATGILGLPRFPSRIYGGQDAQPGQIPGIVSIRYISDDFHFCGGGIVDATTVITAAHCMVGEVADEIQVVAGSTKLSSGGTRIPASRITYHADYDNPPMQNDIGLIKLSSPLEFNDDIQPLKLASEDTVKANDTVTACGWGDTETGSPDILQWLEGKVWDNADCAAAQGIDIGEGQICYGGVDGEGLCFGDSGSPLIYKGDTTTGIVSFGRPCAVGYPDVFTRTSYYKNWIAEQQRIWAEEDKVAA